MPALYPPDLRGSPPRLRRAGEPYPAPRKLSNARPALRHPYAPRSRCAARLQERLLAVADSGKFILGPEVAAFEAELAAYLGTRVRDRRRQRHRRDRARSCARSASGPGDDVVVPAFTFYASAEAIALTGRAPGVLRRRSRHLLRHRRDRARRADPAHAAVLAVHLFGNIAPVGEIEALGVPVLEDAAQAAGSRLDGGPRPGALGTAATFSFFPSKNLGCFGDGGAVTTDDPDLAERVRMLRFHGSHDKETFELVGYNSRLDELQAAVLRVLLPHLDEWCDGRRAGARAYAAAGPRRPRGAAARRPTAPTRRGISTWSAIRAPTSWWPRWPRRGIGARGLLPGARAPAAGDARVRAGGAAAGHRGGRANEPGAPDEPRAGRRAGRRGGRGRPRCASGLT